MANKTVQNIFFRCTSDDRYLMVTTVAKIMTTVYACKLTEHSNGKKAGHFTVQDDHNFPGTFLQKSGLSFENRDRGHLTLDSWWTFAPDFRTFPLFCSVFHLWFRTLLPAHYKLQRLQSVWRRSKCTLCGARGQNVSVALPVLWGTVTDTLI